MGKFDETSTRRFPDYLAAHYPGIATLVRKDFNEASAVRRRVHRPAAHRRHAHVRGGEQRFQHLVSQAVRPRRRAVPRHERHRAEYGRGGAAFRRPEILRQREGALPALRVLALLGPRRADRRARGAARGAWSWSRWRARRTSTRSSRRGARAYRSASRTCMWRCPCTPRLRRCRRRHCGAAPPAAAASPAAPPADRQARL